MTPFSINFKFFDPSFLQKLRSDWVNFFSCAVPGFPATQHIRFLYQDFLRMQILHCSSTVQNITIIIKVGHVDSGYVFVSVRNITDVDILKQ